MNVVAAMLRSAFLVLVLPAATAAGAQQAVPASVRADPTAARVIFERDWVLMNWALKRFDANRDILLSPAEAEAAAHAFRQIADGDGDGRVTQQEYRAAREFILARY